MKSKITAFVVLFLLVYFQKTSAQLAYLQSIHNCADPTADTVDVYVNGSLTFDDFPFRTATPYLTLPAGNYVIDVAYKNSTAATESFYTSPSLNFASGERYIVLSSGNIGSAGADSFNLHIFNPARIASQISGETDILFSQGAVDFPSMNVTMTGGASSLTDSLDHGEFSGYISLATADYSIELREQGNNNVRKAYEIPLQSLSLSDSAITIISSGFLSPIGSQPGFGLFYVTPAGGSFIPFSVSLAQIQFIQHTSSFDSLDVYLDSGLTINNFGNFHTSSYYTLTAGVTHALAPAPKTSTSAADAYDTFPLILEPNKKYIGIFNGTIAAGPPQTQLNFYTYSPARVNSIVSYQTDMLFFNGNFDDTATVDVFLDDTVLLGNDLAYGEFNDAGYNSIITNDSSIIKVAHSSVDIASFLPQLETLGLTGDAVPVIISGGSLMQLAIGLPYAAPLITIPFIDAIEEFADHALFNIYPNPANDHVTINLKNKSASFSSVAITDITGRIVYKAQVPGGNFRIDTRELKNGFYTIKLTGRETSSVAKMLVNH